MKSTARYCNYIVAFTILLFLSCSKEKTEKLVYRDLSFDPVSVLDRIPDGLKESGNPYAKLVYNDITTLLDWGEFTNQLTLPGNALKQFTGATSETYRWNLNTGNLLLLITLTFSTDDDDYRWQDKIQYGLGFANEYLTARENKAGTGGSLDYNTGWICGIDQLTDPCDPTYRHYEWVLHNDGSLAYIARMEEQTMLSVVKIEYRLVLSADGSGNVTAYTGTEQYYHVGWNNQGNGVYTLHEGEVPITYEW